MFNPLAWGIFLFLQVLGDLPLRRRKGFVMVVKLDEQGIEAVSGHPCGQFGCKTLSPLTGAMLSGKHRLTHTAEEGALAH